MENRKTNDRQLISLLGGIPELIGDGYRLVQIGAHRKELDRTAHGTPMEGILPHYGAIAIHTGTAGNPDGETFRITGYSVSVLLVVYKKDPNDGLEAILDYDTEAQCPTPQEALKAGIEHLKKGAGEELLKVLDGIPIPGTGNQGTEQETNTQETTQ